MGINKKVVNSRGTNDKIVTIMKDSILWWEQVTFAPACRVNDSPLTKTAVVAD